MKVPPHTVLNENEGALLLGIIRLPQLPERGLGELFYVCKVL